MSENSFHATPLPRGEDAFLPMGEVLRMLRERDELIPQFSHYLGWGPSNFIEWALFNRMFARALNFDLAQRQSHQRPPQGSAGLA